MIRKIDKKKLICIILSFIILSILSICLFIKVKFHALALASDMQFHLRRILELKESIEHGHILPEFSFNFFHGTPVMSMYPFLGIYPFVLLLFIVHSVIKSYYIFAALVTFITLLISFFSSLRYSKSVLISYIFSIAYGLSSTFSFGFFSSGDLGLTTALSVLPLAIFGFIDILHGSNNYLKLSFGLIFLLFCHIPSFTITVIFLMLWFILNIKRFNKSSFKNLIRASIVGLLITSLMWIPMIYISATTKIYSVKVPKILPSVSPKYFIGNAGTIAPFAIIISIFFFKKFNKTNKQMYILSLLFCFMSTRFMPWYVISQIPIIKLVNTLQFAYRFLIVPLILLCYLFAKCVNLIIQSANHKKLLISIPLIFLILLQLSFQSFEIHHKLLNSSNLITSYKTITYNSRCTLINNKSAYYLTHGFFPNNDYSPKLSMPVKEQIWKNNILSNNGYNSKLHQIRYNNFTFHTKKFSKTLTLPFIHYNNEHLKLYINNHKHSSNVSKHGLINIHNIKRGKNTLKIRYLPNRDIIISKYILFTLGIIWCICTISLHDKSHHKIFNS